MNDNNDNKEKNFISSVIYVHNSQDRIAGFLKAVIRVMEDNFENSEIICVNDFSEDNSLAVIKKVCDITEKTSVSVINMSHFHGTELAMSAGADMSIGDFVFEFDNTFLDFDPELIMQVYRRCLEGFDIVSASPDRKEKLSSRLFYKVFDRFTSVSYHMSSESFRILSRRVINRVGSANKSVFYRKALYANCGLKICNIKYHVKQDVELKQDKLEKHYRSSLAVDSLVVFTKVGYRFSMVMTVLMMIISLVMIVYTIITYLTVNPVRGWTTTILLLSICFLGMFAVQTIIIKYLQLLVNMVYRRKQYSFESIEKLTK